MNRWYYFYEIILFLTLQNEQTTMSHILLQDVSKTQTDFIVIFDLRWVLEYSTIFLCFKEINPRRSESKREENLADGSEDRIVTADAGANFVVLGLSVAHLVELVGRGQDGTSEPHSITLHGVRDNVSLHWNGLSVLDG